MRIPSKLIAFYHKLDEVDETKQLSSLLRSYAVVKYSNETPEVSLTAAIRDLTSLAIQFFKGMFWNVSSIELEAGLPILTFMSPRPHLYKMNDLLANEFSEGCNRAYFYNSDGLIQSSSSSILAGLPHKVLSREVLMNWRSISQATKLFRNYVKEEQLSATHVLPFWVHAIRQYAALGSFKKLFRDRKFPFIVCEYDQYNQIAAFLMAAKLSGISTYTQTHGLLNTQYAYTPLIANKIFVWGNYHKKVLMDWGIAKENILVSGAIQYQSNPEIDFKTRLQVLDELKLNERIVVIATNPMTNDIRKALIEFINNFALSIPADWSIILRPHPSESKDEYEAAVKKLNNVQVLNNQELDMVLLMQISTVAMVWNSAFAIDALVNRIPTIQIKLNFKDAGEVTKLVELGLIPSFNEPQEIIDFMGSLKIINDSNTHELNDAQFEKFKTEYCINFGEEAAKQMHRHIEQECQT
jgi:hypothetical protein